MGPLPLFDPPSAPGHQCACHADPSSEAPPGLFLHGVSTHVHSKLSGLSAAHAFEEQHGAFFVPGAQFHLLPGLLGAFSRTEQPELLAAPQMAHLPQPDPWQAGLLTRWLKRVQSAWYPEALRHLQFHMQPIVDLRSGDIHGFEALVRAVLPQGLIGAGELLGAADAFGHQRGFDALARRTAIIQCAPELAPSQSLFVNFAPGVVYNPDVCLNTTFRACVDAGIDLSRLVFEVTESEVFPDLDTLGEILNRYRAEGARVALDDLGAGNTSLMYLSVLRPDIVKLDRALCIGLTPDDLRCTLIRSLIAYAHDLGIQVVAEGVEELSTVALLRELGADLAQGYALGRPQAHIQPLAPAVAALWPAQP